MDIINPRVVVQPKLFRPLFIKQSLGLPPASPGDIIINVLNNKSEIVARVELLQLWNHGKSEI